MLSNLDNARAAIAELGDRVKKEILRRLRSHIGVNRAAGKNTLIGSNLEKSIDIYVTPESNGLVFVIADYFSFVAGGRRAGLTPRGQNVYGAIQSWVRRNNIQLGNMTENQVIWAVLQKLKRADIPPRPFIQPDYDYSKDMAEVIPFLEKYIDDWMDDLFDTLTAKIDNTFK